MSLAGLDFELQVCSKRAERRLAARANRKREERERERERVRERERERERLRRKRLQNGRKHSGASPAPARMDRRNRPALSCARRARASGFRPAAASRFRGPAPAATAAHQVPETRAQRKEGGNRAGEPRR